jgi:Short C-terminal domain/Domain of unknown function (DUF4429)
MRTYIILAMYLQNPSEPVGGGFVCVGVIVIILIALVVSSNRKRKAAAEAKSIYRVSGVGGDLEVFEGKLTITPRGAFGFLNKGIKGTKTIPFTSITAIQYKEPGLTNGYLQLTVPGGNESRRGVFAAASDENSFMFRASQSEVMQEVKLYIERRVEELSNRSGTSAVAASMADEVLKLAKLKDQGLLTEEEFATAKEKLLAR